jgi:hypothetical protein
VAKETIRRIRNENLTEEERAALKKSANIKGRLKRELGKAPKEGGVPMEPEVKTKICKKYGPPHEKPLGEFAKNASTLDGLERACKKCLQRYRAERKKKTEKEMKLVSGKGFTIPQKPIFLPMDTIKLEAQLIQGVRKALRREFGEELIKLIQ